MIDARQAKALAVSNRQSAQDSELATLLVIAEQAIRSAVERGDFSVNLEPFDRFNTDGRWADQLRDLGYNIDSHSGRNARFCVSWGGA